MVIKIAIDAGHGSNTAGKRTPSGYREHWANTKVASYFAKAMDRCGIEYIKTGWNDDNATDDTDIALSTRQQQIKAAKCDYSISFHFNASGDGKTYNTAEGIETLISNKSAGDSLKMANCVHKYLIQGTKQKNRGVKTQSLAMCNCGTMGVKAAILCELAFMTNSGEAQLMQSDAFCLECAEEAAKGFCEYVGVKYVASGSSTVKPTTSSTTSSTAKYYRVQCGAFSKIDNANALKTQLQAKGFTAIVKKIDGLYKCQIGAYSNKANAENMLLKLKQAGFSAFVTYC